MARVTKNLQLQNVFGSYVKVVEPGKKFDNTGLEYSMQIIIPKDHPQIDELKDAITDCLKEGFPKLSAAQKQSLKKGLRDSDAEGRSEEFDYLKNTYFLNAKRPESFGPVPCFDRSARPIVPTHDTLYSGCLLNVSVSIFTFDAAASKGVSCGLNGVQIVDNTLPRWDGTVAASNMFTALPGAEPMGSFQSLSADAQADDDDIPW
jgi:hypothetical protein